MEGRKEQRKEKRKRGGRKSRINSFQNLFLLSRIYNITF
jgi:hypothetical protein